jgi:3-oxoacyl-[acyl-carrier protein] reductase
MKRGSIINISSIRGHLGHGREGIAAYCAAKAALHSFTTTLATTLAPHITVNAVAPGFVATSYLQGINHELRKSWLDAIPLGRFITPDEIAETVVHLATSRHVTGAIVTADGGFALNRN